MLDREPIIDATVRDGSVKRYGGLSARACPLHNPADIRRLLDAARDYDQRQPEGWWPWPTYFTDIISGYLYLGLRDQELVHLEWNDVDLAMRTVRIRQKQVVCTRRITLGEAAVKLAASLAKGRSPKARLVGEGEDLPTVGRILHVQDEGLLRGLRVADFNAEKGTLMVRDEYQWQPKGYEGKPIPIPPPLFEILNRMSHHRSSNFVYPDRDQGYRKFHFDRVLKEIVAAAGLPSGFRTHDLRHSYAVQLRRSGARLETIKELMRHAMIEDTLVYAVYDDGEGSAAVSKLSFG
jgi:integrase